MSVAEIFKQHGEAFFRDKEVVKIAFIYSMIKECNQTVEFIFSNDLYDWLQV